MQLRFGSSFLFLASLAACTSDTAAVPPESSSGDEITAGEIVAGDSPYYWANIDYEAHRAVMASLGAPLSDHEAPADDPIRERLQAWANRFDGALRQVTGNTAAPRPIVKFLGSAQTYNAWSSGTYVRLGARLEPTVIGPDNSPFSLVGLTRPADALQEDWSSIVGSAVVPPGWNRLASFTQVWNLAKGPCKLTSTGNVLRLAPSGTDCGERNTLAEDVGTVATTPFLTFSSDLVAVMPTERALVSVLAHELGHMYRAHTSPLTEREYGFWYDDGAHLAVRPVPSALDAELRTTYARLVRDARALDSLTTARLLERSRLPVLALAYLGAFDSCAEYTAWTTTNDLEGLLAQARDGSAVFPEQETAYLAFEAAIATCPNTDVFAAVTERAEQDAVVQLPQASFTTSLESLLPNAHTVMPEVGETVAAYLVRLEERSARDEADEHAFVARIRTERIGLYTHEQEADEIALELMTRVGYTEEEALEAWLESNQGFDTVVVREVAADDPGSARSEQCGAWLRDGFMTTDAAGARTPLLMTLGSLADSHHGDCYRLYNLWREAKAHRIPRVAKPAELLPAWEELQRHAVELTETAASEGH